MLIGQVPLRDLTAQDVRRTLNKLAQTRSTRTMASTHNVLVRAIRHAEANDRVGRNGASFVKPPQGKTGRPSRAMTASEAAALLAAAKDHPRFGAYVILSLTTGIRTEEARALRWDHVDLDGDPDARTPVPPSIAVWRSVRLHGDTKTEKSRRTLALPQNTERLTGEPVRSEYRMPGTGTPVPPADAVLACPLTFNSVNKFARGHADNFAVGLLCEMVGYGVPVVVVPHCKPQLASHPAFTASLQTLRGMGVRVLFDPDAPYERRLPPWREVIDALPVRAGAG